MIDFFTNTNTSTHNNHEIELHGPQEKSCMDHKKGIVIRAWQVDATQCAVVSACVHCVDVGVGLAAPPRLFYQLCCADFTQMLPFGLID